jgi:hypothetical protein
VALLLVAIGLVWIGQGFGLLRGRSFMVDDIRWAVIGAVLVAGGLAWELAGRRRRTGR